LTCVKNKKAHKNQFCELSDALLCQLVIPLGLPSVIPENSVWEEQNNVPRFA